MRRPSSSTNVTMRCCAAAGAQRRPISTRKNARMRTQSAANRLGLTCRVLDRDAVRSYSRASESLAVVMGRCHRDRQSSRGKAPCPETCSHAAIPRRGHAPRGNVVVGPRGCEAAAPRHHGRAPSPFTPAHPCLVSRIRDLAVRLYHLLVYSKTLVFEPYLRARPSLFCHEPSPVD